MAAIVLAGAFDGTAVAAAGSPSSTISVRDGGSGADGAAVDTDGTRAATRQRWTAASGPVMVATRRTRTAPDPGLRSTRRPQSSQSGRARLHRRAGPITVGNPNLLGNRDIRWRLQLRVLPESAPPVRRDGARPAHQPNRPRPRRRPLIPMDRLERLAALQDRGLITDEEFTAEAADSRRELERQSASAANSARRLSPGGGLPFPAGVVGAKHPGPSSNEPPVPVGDPCGRRRPGCAYSARMAAVFCVTLPGHGQRGQVGVGQHLAVVVTGAGWWLTVNRTSRATSSTNCGATPSWGQVVLGPGAEFLVVGPAGIYRVVKPGGQPDRVGVVGISGELFRRARGCRADDRWRW